MLDARVSREVSQRDWAPLAKEEVATVCQKPGKGPCTVDALDESVNKLMRMNIATIMRPVDNMMLNLADVMEEQKDRQEMMIRELIKSKSEREFGQGKDVDG